MECDERGNMSPVDLKGNIIIASIQPERYVDSTISIINQLTKEGKGIYIAASRPYDVFAPLLKDNGIKTEDIFFVDCISSLTGIPAEEKNVRYIPTPTMLELIPIHIDMAMSENPSFLILDSISSLTIYNSERAMIEFLHYLISKMRQKKTKTILLVIGENHIVQSLSMLCDQVIKI